MITVRKIMANVRQCTQNNVESVRDMAQKMTPVDEDSLRLPRSFAHTVRLVLENEAKHSTNKVPEGANRKLAGTQQN